MNFLIFCILQVPLQQQVLQQQFQQQHQVPPVHYRQPQPLPTYDNNMETEIM